METGREQDMFARFLIIIKLKINKFNNRTIVYK